MDPNATSVEISYPVWGRKCWKPARKSTTETGGPLYHPHACQLEEHCRYYLECYHCGPAHPGFSDSVQVIVTGTPCTVTGRCNTVSPNVRTVFQIRRGHGCGIPRFLAWPCTMLNVTPIKGMMTVIYDSRWILKLPCKTTIFTSPMKVNRRAKIAD